MKREHNGRYEVTWTVSEAVRRGRTCGEGEFSSQLLYHQFPTLT